MGPSLGNDPVMNKDHPENALKPKEEIKPSVSLSEKLKEKPEFANYLNKLSDDDLKIIIQDNDSARNLFYSNIKCKL